MASKITELNRQLRRSFLILGALFALLKILAGQKPTVKEDNDGYQTKEFDDIW